MQGPSFDPGLTQQYNGPLRRTINADGSFNVVRRGTNWHDIHPYLHLVTMPWWAFFGTVVFAYALLNLAFASIYFSLGPGAVSGEVGRTTVSERFLADLFFSSQTLTTVGFGAIWPKSPGANLVAAFEALTGLLGFAVATGVLLGRVSKPSARIAFSETALMAPYQDGYALQFRVVNRRTNSITELEATVVLMTVNRKDGGFLRRFDLLKLEREKIMFFPLTWTVVHPVDAQSPLWNETAENLEQLQAEVLILLKGWDETFGQTVHQRYSYRFDEIVWNGKFDPAFSVDENGDMILEVGKVGAHQQLSTGR